MFKFESLEDSSMISVGGLNKITTIMTTQRDFLECHNEIQFSKHSAKTTSMLLGDLETETISG